MLKKVTITSILILLIALVVAVAAVPMAVKDFFRKGDQILGGILSTTPVSSFDGAQYDAVHISMGNSQIYLEQSSDDKIYMRVEGLFADSYSIATENLMIEDKLVLNIRFDSEGLFFNDNISSYLLRRALMEGTYSAIILRIPSTVAVTADYPYLVNYSDTVQFANRSYYDSREWRRADEERFAREMEIQESTEQMKQRFYALRDACNSEMDAVISRQYTLENSAIDDLDDEIDAIAVKYGDNMKAELFPFSPAYQNIETLRLLLQNYMDIAAAYKKQAARNESYYDKDPDEAFEIQETARRLEQLTQEAYESFHSMYVSYLNAAAAEMDETADGAQEAPRPEETDASSAEDGETADGAAASSAPDNTSAVTSSLDEESSSAVV